ncbi:MAG: WYL domain-containing transcriptional regulator [Pirellulaceae bacterium]|nr:WYL domain-containing transcriptional regulator [Pirellulaceae bacterium]
MARNEQLIRQHKIIQVLERLRFGATLEELRDAVVEELGLTSLHTRSIRRDIEALVAAGMPIMDEENARGRVWKMSRADKGLQKIAITASEMIALSMGRQLMLPLVGTQFWIGIESFWNKVKEQLPSSVWDHYQRYRRTLYVLGTPAKSYEKQQGMLKTVNRAIQEHRHLEIEYQSIGKPAQTRVIEPYGVVVYQSSIYVIATEEARDGQGVERLKHWKLDRFLAATALDAWFKPNDSIDVETHLGQTVGIFSGAEATTYEIRLSPHAARWVQEDPWHAQQSFTAEADGGGLLRVPAYHDMEIVPRVLQLGHEAELISPASCRKLIADTIHQMSARYQSAAGGQTANRRSSQE